MVPEPCKVISNFLYSVKFKYIGIFYSFNESFTHAYFYNSMHQSLGNY